MSSNPSQGFGSPGFPTRISPLPTVEGFNSPGPIQGNLTPFAGSPQPVISTLPSVPGFVPPILGVGAQQLPTVTLPTVGIQGLPSITNQFSQMSVGSLNLWQPTMTYLLQDNQTAELIWNYPNVPHPQNPQSRYRRIGCIGDGSCLFHAILKGISPLYLQSYRTPNEITEQMLTTFEQTVRYRVLFEDYLFNIPRNRLDPGSRYIILNRAIYASRMDKFRHEYAAELRGDIAFKIQNDPQMQNIVKRTLQGSIDVVAQEVVSQYFPNIHQEMIETENGRLIEQTIEANPQIFEEATQRTYRELIRELLSGQAVQPDFLVILSEYTGFDFYLLRDIDLMEGNPQNVPLYGGQQFNTSILGPQDMRPNSDPRKDLPNRNAIVIISSNDFHYELVGRVDSSPDRQREFKVNFDQAEPIIRTLYAMLRALRQD